MGEKPKNHSRRTPSPREGPSAPREKAAARTVGHHLGEQSLPAASQRVLAGTLEAHIQQEADSVEAYRTVAETCPDPAVVFLMRLVLEEEERHHALFERMIATLRQTPGGERTGDALAKVSALTGEGAAKVERTIEAFASQEQRATRSMRRLAGHPSSKPYPLFGLLLELMARDSEKHEHIFRFLLTHLGQVREAAQAASVAGAR